jgi:hypothetical protein
MAHRTTRTLLALAVAAIAAGCSQLPLKDISKEEHQQRVQSDRTRVQQDIPPLGTELSLD